MRDSSSIYDLYLENFWFFFKRFVPSNTSDKLWLAAWQRNYIIKMDETSINQAVIYTLRLKRSNLWLKLITWISVYKGQIIDNNSAIKSIKESISANLEIIKSNIRNPNGNGLVSLPKLTGKAYGVTGHPMTLRLFLKITEFVYPNIQFWSVSKEGNATYELKISEINPPSEKAQQLTIPVCLGHMACFWTCLDEIIVDGEITTESIFSTLLKKKIFLGMNYLTYQDLQQLQKNAAVYEVVKILKDQESRDAYLETVEQDREKIWLSYFSSIINHTQYFDYLAPKDNSIILNIGVAEGFEIPGLLAAFGPTVKIFNIDPHGYVDLSLPSLDCVNQNPNNFELAVVAIADKDGEVEMDVGAMFEDKRVRRRNTGRIKRIPSLRLPTFLAKHNIDRVDFIKIDIEGAEEFIIDDLIDIMNQYRPQTCLSIYHKVAHFVDLPLRLSEKVENYNYYFRRYSALFEEATLYCVPNS